MMRNDINADDLTAVLEKIRTEKYPDIPAELIRAIVEAEFADIDNRPKASRAAKKLIDDHMRTVAVPADTLAAEQPD